MNQAPYRLSLGIEHVRAIRRMACCNPVRTPSAQTRKETAPTRASSIPPISYWNLIIAKQDFDSICVVLGETSAQDCAPSARIGRRSGLRESPAPSDSLTMMPRRPGDVWAAAVAFSSCPLVRPTAPATGIIPSVGRRECQDLYGLP